ANIIFMGVTAIIWRSRMMAVTFGVRRRACSTACAGCSLRDERAVPSKPAVLALRAAGVAFTPHFYAHEKRDGGWRVIRKIPCPSCPTLHPEPSLICSIRNRRRWPLLSERICGGGCGIFLL